MIVDNVRRELMKTYCTVALSMLAGAALGGAAIQALHAQGKPPVYYVAKIDVTNPDAYSSPAAAAFHVSLAIPALLRAVDTHHGYSQPERR